ncbi:MAG: 50S ribosomal protein L9 [Deltaproteobacteria bacterium]|nr:50S ribosomal protein L9 [Deltaproteobacteria bacterium]
MKVILSKDVESLGSMGSIVNVKDGYARNYLIPRSFAIVANDANRKELEHRKKVIEIRKEKILKEMKALAQKIGKIKLVVSKQVGEEERIFGSVTTAEIAEMLTQKGFEVSKKVIHFSEEIKKLGTYTAEVKLHPEVTASVKVKIEAAEKTEK